VLRNGCGNVAPAPLIETGEGVGVGDGDAVGVRLAVGVVV